MVKCRFWGTLRKRLDPRNPMETKLKLVAHDIRRMGDIEILYDIKPHWPRKEVWGEFYPKPGLNTIIPINLY